MLDTISRPECVSLCDIQREYVRACRTIRLSVNPEAIQVATLYRSQLRAWRRARLVAVARKATGDATIGVGLEGPLELARLSAESGSTAVRMAARTALAMRAEEAHLKTVLGIPGRLPVPR